MEGKGPEKENNIRRQFPRGTQAFDFPDCTHIVRFQVPVDDFLFVDVLAAASSTKQGVKDSRQPRFRVRGGVGESPESGTENIHGCICVDAKLIQVWLAKSQMWRYMTSTTFKGMWTQSTEVWEVGSGDEEQELTCFRWHRKGSGCKAPG